MQTYRAQHKRQKTNTNSIEEQRASVKAIHITYSKVFATRQPASWLANQPAGQPPSQPGG